MGLKMGRPSKGDKLVKPLVKGVKSPAIEENTNRQKQRHKELPENKVIEEAKAELSEIRKTRDFETITLVGSKGQKYRVVVPASYVAAIPKKWEWTPERYRVAELVAEGIPLAQIPNHPGVTIKSRMTIYGWLEHPEFKEHVDGLVMETGWANRRERIAKLERLNERLLDKVLNELDNVKLTDKMMGSLLTAIQGGSKLIAQEKGEFIEESKVTQDTTLSGSVGTVHIEQTFDQFMEGKTEDERKALEKEFEKVGDEIIRSLTGEKDKN